MRLVVQYNVMRVVTPTPAGCTDQFKEIFLLESLLNFRTDACNIRDIPS